MPEIRGDRRAIAAFSGGVDSVFTILRHNRDHLGNASYPLHHSVLMVHGFDVPLSSPEQLVSLRERTKPLLDELKLKSLTMRTNLKEINLQDWEDSFMAQLACCLHNYSHNFYYALVGSSEPDDGSVLPWGSNPATDYLLSGGTMRLVHDGAGFSRTEKVAYIANNRTASRVLKVCWEGGKHTRTAASARSASARRQTSWPLHWRTQLALTLPSILAHKNDMATQRGPMR